MPMATHICSRSGGVPQACKVTFRLHAAGAVDKVVDNFVDESLLAWAPATG